MFKGALRKLSGSEDKKKSKKKDKKKKKEEEEFEEAVEEAEEIEEGEAFGGFDEVGGLEEEEDELGQAGKITELETRLKDLENEVGLVSSKLNTIKAENEEIGKRLEEIEENIRKLLGIYEMVTEGINPFATEVMGDEDGFGLFSALNKDKPKEDVPEELLSKDAESFFEDIDEEEIEEPVAAPTSVEESNTAESEESPEEKFMRLKKELEAQNQQSQQQEQEQEQQSPEPEFETQQDEISALEMPEIQEQETHESIQEVGERVGQDEEQRSSVITGPYLKKLRRDYISDILVLKWLDYLVTTFGIKRMAELLDFYVDIGWISREVKEFLINCSRGYTLRDMQFNDDVMSNVPTLRDHIKSLVFISKLSGGEIKVEDIEKAIREIEELEKEVNEVVPSDHGALDISC